MSSSCNVFSIVSKVQCFWYRESIHGAAITAYVTGSTAIGRGMYSSCCFLCWQQCCAMCWMGWGWQPNPALSAVVACSAWTAVWNVGRVAAKVEVTSSRSFLFIFLFPEFHCYYSNNRWSKLSPLSFHSGTVTVTNVNKMLILEMCADQKHNLVMFLLLLVVHFLLILRFSPSPYSSLFI